MRTYFEARLYEASPEYIEHVAGHLVEGEEGQIVTFLLRRRPMLWRAAEANKELYRVRSETWSP